ncbi:MAG: hypothetical protein AAFP76_01420 [Bacteroidota bacterium]
MKSILFTTFIFAMVFSHELKAQNTVYVNDVRVPQQTLHQLAAHYNIQIQDGRYWYDQYTGAWGVQGGPTLGFALPFMNLGGPLKANASNGNTRVFVNGRELHYRDVQALQRIITVIPGRYWLDSKGNGGYEGAPASFNLLYLARQSGGSTFFRNSYTGIGGGSSGGTSYVIGKDFSVIVD